MNRSEFLDKLREALENDLSGPVVRENIEYYDSYIQSEVRNGKTEQEVLDMLRDILEKEVQPYATNQDEAERT